MASKPLHEYLAKHWPNQACFNSFKLKLYIDDGVDLLYC